jgi:site-specific DNA recombinase
MLEEELRLLGRDTDRWNSELYKLAPELQSSKHDSQEVARLADLQDRIRLNERRAIAVTEEIDALNIQLKKNLDSEGQGSPTTTLWESMTTRDQLRLIQAVIKRIDYDGASGRVTIIFNPIDSDSCSEATTRNLSDL